jgi:hypothetical protein
MSPAHERLHALWLSRWPAREAALVAFVIPRAGAACDADELRLWLAQTLPSHMLPARIVLADELPRTPAGKADRLALHPPAGPSEPRRTAVAPRTAVEARVADLFEQVLDARPDSVEDDFFAHLGGHSLLATQLASLVRREWPIEFELRWVFEHPTVAGLAACVERAHRRSDPLGRIPRRIDPHGSGD